MKDTLNTLTGIEFESLCQLLLQKAGFDVKTTKASGDGGIDLIAYNNQPFFLGKYIIQCKRYLGSVGEPIVRDLYGVVMAEHANKGILLTTGWFTVSAIRFAENKNLELIDKDKLIQLLSKYNLLKNSHSIHYKHFTQHECFNIQKYQFYKNSINQNQCSFEMGHDFLFEFMFDYMKAVGKNKKINAMLDADFAKEYLNLFDWYTEKYYKKEKERLKILPSYIRKYKGLAHLLNYDLFAFVQERYILLTKSYITLSSSSKKLDADIEKIIQGGKNSSEPVKNLVKQKRIKFSFSKKNVNLGELLNLLSIFSYFKIESGITMINKLLYGTHPHLKDIVEMQKDYQNAINYVKIHYFDYNKHYYSYAYTYSGSINLTFFYDQNVKLHKDKIREEVSKIESFISAFS